jgi:hypothetical protein
MKFVRFLVLLASIGGIPGLVLQVVGQQEIDPEHFDQAELAKAASRTVKPNASPRKAAVKDPQKAAGRAASASRTTGSPRQAKTENQQTAAAHSMDK